MSSQSTLTNSDDDGEPWHNRERLQSLYHDDDLDQSEIAAELDTTASTISYWMNKLGVNTSHTSHSGRRRTEDVVCRQCGGETPGANLVCDDCLELVRRRDSVASYDDYTEFLKTELSGLDEVDNYIEALRGNDGHPLSE